MKVYSHVSLLAILYMIACASVGHGADQSTAVLPQGVKAVWDINKARHEKTPKRERVCINGLWRWQPAQNDSQDVPIQNWGYFKVPGPWPSAKNGSQELYRHPSWKSNEFSALDTAWYQREIEIPTDWTGRRIAISAEYLNSYAAVYLDGKKLGEMHFPWGHVDITSACRPGTKHLLSIRVAAMPLESAAMVYNQTGEGKRAKGKVARRGLCGDVFLTSTPAAERIGDVKIDTSVRKWQITFDTALDSLMPSASYTLRAVVRDGDKQCGSFTSEPFQAAALKGGRFSFTGQWKPEKLWDLHTPGNMYTVEVALLKDGEVLDVYQPVRFGFREFYIDGRDFYLNGSRVFCMIVPLESANGGPYEASYEGARQTLTCLKKMGINTVFTHHYNCQPGVHSALGEILQAADDVGMLISLTQPHFSNYDWKAPDAAKKNGYVRHAEFYVRMAQNHPSVVMYSTSHNATQYREDLNPDQIGDATGLRDTAGARENAEQALKAEAILRSLDPTRVVYHHSSGNLSQMYTANCYLNFVPIQERSDWFEHWATQGVLPAMLVEYGPPLPPSFTMYRGWYKGQRTFLEANVPWELCTAEWASQFLGDRAFQVTDIEKENLRFEARQSRSGRRWQRFSYPCDFNSQRFSVPNRCDVQALYIKDNWPAFRTWGLSGPSGWSYDRFFVVRPDFAGKDTRPKVDWDHLQRPGYSVDLISGHPQLSDWVPNSAGQAFLRYSQPLLAYIGGKPARFTSKDHNFLPGQKVDKQLIVINNSRQTVECDCSSCLALPQPKSGRQKITVKTGEQGRIRLEIALPTDLAPGSYRLTMTMKPASGEPQTDSFDVNVLPAAPPDKLPTVDLKSKLALFDPKGETRKLLESLGVRYDLVNADTSLADYDLLIVGKAALSPEGPAPNIGRVHDGLKVVMFEQTSDALEQRLGFRVEEYGLRNVFARVADHPLLAGLDNRNLHDWQGEATIMPPRLKYEIWPQHGPSIVWAGIKVTRPYRCGCWGNVASVLIEKPTRGDFLPIIDGGFSLQYSPLMEYREGKGMVLFCQMDVTGRTEADPAAERLTRNILAYASAWKPAPRRQAVYVGEPAGKDHLQKAGISVGSYDGQELSADHVLIVGPSGGRQLSAHADAIRKWIEAGGHLLAIGLDQADADASLPLKTAMTKREHIAANFPPLTTSLLAGVGPADVYNRDPRELPLVSAGATPIGDGVLATTLKGNIVLCQLAPWQFDYSKAYHLKRTFRRVSFLLTRLLGNMGVDSGTLLVTRVNTPVAARKSESRWLDGLYLDRPEEWDDPYRFFRW